MSLDGARYPRAPSIMSARDDRDDAIGARAASRTLPIYVIIVALIYLQKIAIPLGGLQQISCMVPIIYLALAIGLQRGAMQLRPLRLAAFAVMLTAMVSSLMLLTAPFSILSFILVLLICTPLCFAIPMTDAEWLRIPRFFNAMMIAPSALVPLQIAHQLLFHWRTLSLERFIPHKFLMSGFYYEAQYHWGQPFVRPNGFFMLEPSFSSLFTAIALIIELCLFRRWPLMLLFAGSLAVNLGASGYLFFALALPFIFLKAPVNAKILSLIAAPILLLVVGLAGGARMLTDRLGELSQTHSSGSGRLIEPFLQLLDILRDPRHLVTGIGPGNIALVFASWPFVKIVSEYGFLAGLGFVTFQLSAVGRAGLWAVAFPLLIIFNFTGGYLLNPVFCALLIIFVTGVERRSDLVPVTGDRA
jgi:hypothetical protein